MKNKFIIITLAIIMCFSLAACSNKEKDNTNTSTKATEIEGNTQVGYLRFYVPSDYTYRTDLRGLAYSESQKKVYIKGDYENNPNGVIYLISALEYTNTDVKEFVDKVNNNLSDNDIKFTLKTNSKKQEVYARENYIISGNLNYAYIVGLNGDVYVVNVKGPQDKSSEITALATNVFESLYVR